jgi:hypothetical protein
VTFPRGRLIAFATCMAAAVAAYGCGNSPGYQQTQQNTVSGEYLVTLAPTAEASAITDVYGRFGIKSMKGLGNNVFLVTFIQDPGQAAMDKLRAGNVQIKAVQPNYRYRSG